MKQNQNKLFPQLLSILFCIGVWLLLAYLIGAPLILPSPLAVFSEILKLLRTSSFWLDFLLTFLRVLISFAISVISGLLLGIASAKYSFVNDFLKFPISVIRSTPVVALILPAMFWFTSGIVPVFVAVLMALPVMTASSYSGFTPSYDTRQRLFKAQCLGLRGWIPFWYIKVPAALPSVKAGAEAVFGLCWKVVAAGEVLSLPKKGAGSLMHTAQVHLETARVLAVTLILVLACHLTQKAFKLGRGFSFAKNIKKHYNKSLQ